MFAAAPRRRARAGRGQDVDEADAAALEQALNVAKTIAARRLGETEHVAWCAFDSM